MHAQHCTGYSAVLHSHQISDQSILVKWYFVENVQTLSKDMYSWKANTNTTSSLCGIDFLLALVVCCFYFATLSRQHPLQLGSHKGIIIVCFFSVAFYRPRKRLCAVCARQNAIIDLRFATFQSHNMITTLNKIKLPISLESLRRTNNIWKKWITVEHRARSTSNEF